MRNWYLGVTLSDRFSFVTTTLKFPTNVIHIGKQIDNILNLQQHRHALHKLACLVNNPFSWENVWFFWRSRWLFSTLRALLDDRSWRNWSDWSKCYFLTAAFIPRRFVCTTYGVALTSSMRVRFVMLSFKAYPLLSNSRRSIRYWLQLARSWGKHSLGAWHFPIFKGNGVGLSSRLSTACNNNGTEWDSWAVCLVKICNSFCRLNLRLRKTLLLILFRSYPLNASEPQALKGTSIKCEVGAGCHLTNDSWVWCYWWLYLSRSPFDHASLTWQKDHAVNANNWQQSFLFECWVE